MRLNNKGFTLVEILAVIVILSVLSGVAVLGVMSTIRNGKNKSYEVMIGNIASASEVLYEEVENGYLTGSALYNYDLEGQTMEEIKIYSGIIEVNLQTLVSNGFLNGISNTCNDDACENANGKVLLNPKDSSDLGNCSIVITKCGVTTRDDASYCPTTMDFNKYFKGNFVYSDEVVLVNEGLRMKIFNSGGLSLGNEWRKKDNGFELVNVETVTLDNYSSLSNSYKYGCYDDACDSYYEVDWSTFDSSDSDYYVDVDVYSHDKIISCN